MPLYKTSLRMAHDTTWPSRKKWSNTFYIFQASANIAAAAVAAAYQDFLRQATDESIFAYEVYATSVLEGDDDYAVVSIPPGFQRGTLDDASRGEFYLTKSVVTVELRAESGRPSRKFWRLGLREVDVQQGAEVAGYITEAVGVAFTDFLAGLSPALVDPDNTPLTEVGKLRLGTREFGRSAGADVPAPPVG